MRAFVALLTADDRASSRSRVMWVAAGLGIAWALAIVLLARGAADPRDVLQADAASLMLLGGLGTALVLGAVAFPGDAHSGYLGMVDAAGASRGQIAVARVIARMATLAAVMGAWWAVLQVGSMAIGLGYDAHLTGHTLAMIENNALALAAAALMSSLIGPVASAVFGLIVFITAQAVVNLKAALDQGAIAQTSSNLVNPPYIVFPRAVVSSMMEDHQRRGVTSLAAPELSVNGLDVVVPASHWPNVVWTLAWIVVLVYLTTVGLRRRQF